MTVLHSMINYSVVHLLVWYKIFHGCRVIASFCLDDCYFTIRSIQITVVYCSLTWETVPQYQLSILWTTTHKNSDFSNTWIWDKESKNILHFVQLTFMWHAVVCAQYSWPSIPLLQHKYQYLALKYNQSTCSTGWLKIPFVDVEPVTPHLKFGS